MAHQVVAFMKANGEAALLCCVSGCSLFFLNEPSTARVRKTMSNTNTTQTGACSVSNQALSTMAGADPNLGAPEITGQARTTKPMQGVGNSNTMTSTR